MSYKFINASLPITGKTPKESYRGLFQETLNVQFYNASDWWTIQEETELGSQVYINADVRISHLINAETGLKMGDDWKTILFKEINHEISLGKLYTFDDNTWVTVNTEIIKNLTGTCTVRRCNNSLRWIDEQTGAYYEEPCAIEYTVKEPRDYATGGSPFITPGGFLHITMQFNNRSNKIKQNQRFLFGNKNHWVCYKVVGTGINDFRNQKTYDNNTAAVLILDMVANFVNDELDDIILGIADVNTNLYTIKINKDAVSGIVGDSIQLTTSITYNKDTATRPVVWESSNIKIATVSDTGLVTLKALGTCNITASIDRNPANDVCIVTVSTTPSIISEVVFNPSTNYILEGKAGTYSVYLYENGVQQADAFVSSCNANSVPTTSFAFSQIDDNHFAILNNLRDLESYLTVTCTSGSSITSSIDIKLSGAWQNESI